MSSTKPASPSLSWISVFFGSSNVSAPIHPTQRMLDNCIYTTLQFVPPLLLSYFITTLILQKYTTWKGLKLQKLAGQLSRYPAFAVLIYYSHVTLLDTRFWNFSNYALRQSTSDSPISTLPATLSKHSDRYKRNVRPCSFNS